MRCALKSAEPLKRKNVVAIYECRDIGIAFSRITELYPLVDEVASSISNEIGLAIKKFEFIDNEPIGDNYILYKFHLWIKDMDEYCCSCRVVTHLKRVLFILCTINEKVLRLTNYFGRGIESTKLLRHYISKERFDETLINKEPPGQRFISNFIIYRILGQPKIDLNTWKLKIDGLVKNAIELTYNDLLSMKMISYYSDFHCVTGWSVKGIEWEGVPFREIFDKAKVSSSAKWVYVKSLDDYTTVIPLDDFLHEKSLLVLKMNGKPLTVEQGFPARIFIPHLYGWKGAKWVTEITFIENYKDGYWETLGYHERGNVWYEERFKK